MSVSLSISALNVHLSEIIFEIFDSIEEQVEAVIVYKNFIQKTILLPVLTTLNIRTGTLK